MTPITKNLFQITQAQLVQKIKQKTTYKCFILMINDNIRMLYHSD